MNFCNMLEAINEYVGDDISLEDYEVEIELFCEHVGNKHPELIKNQEECEQ